jgi:hypothetical protein
VEMASRGGAASRTGSGTSAGGGSSTAGVVRQLAFCPGGTAFSCAHSRGFRTVETESGKPVHKAPIFGEGGAAIAVMVAPDSP